MKGKKIELNLRHRLDWREPLEERHAAIMNNLREVGPPFGLKELTPPPPPEFGRELATGYDMRYPISGITAWGMYSLRQEGYGRDRAGYDDFLTIQFNLANNSLDYGLILHQHFPELVKAFRGYRAAALYGSYGFWYGGGVKRESETYNRLEADKSIDLDGRNNIFTLETATYWDALLCQRALGYDRDEVIRRLQGKVPLVMPLMDGVYTVFNDDSDLSYEEFADFNDRLKPVLGLI
jgi:hypothetical protein